ncbi:MAG: hypothetical protein JOZ51_03410 [Chloroflexi bacterium]|nr:hypothetical protein [Chloroflexota bacterium]
MNTVMYPCSCCGSRTLGAPPPGSYLICPVCFWEDLPQDQFWPVPYCRALRQAQRTFQTIGACDRHYIHDVRPAETHEQPPTGWRTIDDMSERLNLEIREAFAEVTRGAGVTLHEADVLDLYGSNEERLAARQLDTDRHWYEVPDDLIARKSSALSFLDAAGFRYYLPAYLSWTLRNYDSSDSNSIHSLLFDLALRPWQEDRTHHESTARARFGLLTTIQSQVVCRALRFLVAYCYPCVDTKLAQTALDQYWGDFCPAPAT